MKDAMLRHLSGAYKFLPGYPDHNDLLYVLFTNSKKPLSIDQIQKLMGVESVKLQDPLQILLEQGVVTKENEVSKSS
jgi:predicted transcriptional regulator